ncbi:peptide chain release factor N(5)-glutamine methyltransferase [Spiroplasma floricola]|uniref:peptide chain release factor N(5)-glutamine methyltransferase n=1 Tax=Spiroplasma floricola 23-6 TaxID=1336749 RepID=A0A2K8SFA3_9MOLU|nr:peptide chain release factor N(5)-glutamine methyltransferase [Spiroplasma floricola]AUB32139.1 release factor glutamine methyltransferase [Spiroplasma floricola 23-6]
MNLNKLKNEYVPNLLTLNEFKEIIINITNKSDFNFVMDQNLSKRESDLFLKIIEEFKETKKPIAYLLNNKYFYKYDFYVNENVLIPRSESELIVEEILKYKLDDKNLFDICCGSGCIGITLKNLNNKINLYLSDISKEALKVSEINLKKHNQKAELFCSDFLSVFEETKIVPDFITINPPYIDVNDSNIGEYVKKYEPGIALFAENNGLKFYKELFNSLDKLFNLNKELIIVCEFGFEQKEEIENIFSSKIVKYNIDFKKDYSNNWRIFIIKSKEQYHGEITR